jgi:lysophospholipase L1-like esterase
LLLAPVWAAEEVAPPPDPEVVAATTPTLDDGWVDIHKRMTADANARAAEIKIVLLGDSITARWTLGAGAQLYKERYAPQGAINLGISADATQHILWRLQHGVLDQCHPQMVLLMIGTNNLGYSEPEAVAYGVWAIVEQIRRTHPETRVLVSAIFPRAQADLTAKAAVVNGYLAKLDDGKMVKYLDFNRQFLNPDGSLRTDWFTDGVHPEKPEAFQVWADAMQPTVDEWLRTPPVLDFPPPPAPVAVPKDLRPATAEARNDWLYREKGFAARAARGNCDLLFLGGIQMALWDRVGPLFTKEYGTYRPLNGANWGTRTESLLWQIDNDGLKGLSPKLIVVHLQDQLDTVSAKAVAAGMTAVVGRLREKFPAAKVLVIGAFPKGESPNDPRRQKIADYNTRLSALADGKSVFYLDIGQGFLGADGKLARGAAPGPDGYDPKSFDRWADLWRDTLTGLMNQP